MSTNIGTLVTAAIRPADSLDLIASAYAFEINGGHHSYATIALRDSIIGERREWGMLCSVYSDSDPSKNGTYQLKYNYVNTTIGDNSNWIKFAGSGDAASQPTEYWQDPVLAAITSEPLSPNNGDRYLVGLDDSVAPSGTIWGGYSAGGILVEWNSGISNWDTTIPYSGMTVRIDGDRDSVYRYEGTYSMFNGYWIREKLNQVLVINATSLDGVSFTSPGNGIFSYETDTIYLVNFGTANSGAGSTLDINSLGVVTIKSQSNAGMVDLALYDINPGVIYDLIYDGTYFRLSKPEADPSLVKYRIQAGESVYVPQYSEYFVYGDLTVEGFLQNDGKVVIANGSLNVLGGTVSNWNNVELISLPTVESVGVTGPTGAAGVAGVAGATGAAGIAGATGSNGTSIQFIDIAYSSLQSLQVIGSFSSGTKYYITDREIWVDTLGTSSLANSAQRQQLIVDSAAYVSSGVYLGVWNSSLLPSINDRTIWGGKLWYNLTGVVGSSVDDDTLDGTNWSLVSSGDPDYIYKIFSVEYDFTNDIIVRQSDDRGNIVYYDFSTSTDNTARTDWGNASIYNNVSNGIFNNSNTGGIYMNSVSGVISGNSNSGNIIYNHINGSLLSQQGGVDIESNTCDAVYVISTSNSTPVTQILPASIAVTFYDITVTAKDSTATYSYYGKLSGVVLKNTTYSIINTIDINEKTNFPNATSNITTDGTYVYIEVTGEAATDIDWIVRVDYGTN